MAITGTNFVASPGTVCRQLGEILAKTGDRFEVRRQVLNCGFGTKGIYTFRECCLTTLRKHQGFAESWHL